MGSITNGQPLRLCSYLYVGLRWRKELKMTKYILWHCLIEILDLGDQANHNSVRRNGWYSFRRYVGWEML